MSDSNSLDDFRSAIMLLTLVTYACNNGHSTLNNSFTRRYPDLSGIDPQTLQRLRILRDFTTCGVRNFEVMAAASGPPKTCEVSSHPCDHPGHDNFGDLQDFSDLIQVFLVANPDSADDYFCALPDTQDVRRSISGQSYWSSILEDPWKFLHMNKR